MKTHIKTGDGFKRSIAKHGHRLLCSDGKIRSAELAGEADTWFSIGARIRMNGKWVTGYATVDEHGSLYVHVFRQHDGKTELPEWPPLFTGAYFDLLAKGL